MAGAVKDACEPHQFLTSRHLLHLLVCSIPVTHGTDIGIQLHMYPG